jgi:hypothetical protein
MWILACCLLLMVFEVGVPDRAIGKPDARETCQCIPEGLLERFLDTPRHVSGVYHFYGFVYMNQPCGWRNFPADAAMGCGVSSPV